MVMNLLQNIWLVLLDTAFWLLLGLLAAGLIKAFIPADAMQRWVGGNGIGAILRAALFGAPLPLCSCGVLPAAIGLHRAGASKEATVSFLISTPETSVDSVAVTYALMGPVMAVYRPLAALVSAIVTGMMTALVPEKPAAVTEALASSCCASEPSSEASQPASTSCCASQPTEVNADASSCATDAAPNPEESSRTVKAVRYAGVELLDDISFWMAVGIVLAGVMLTFIPPDFMAQWGGGLSAMLMMLVVGIPMYICAVASTPIAAGLLLAGVSPGAVLVFLLVGPATNIASFALVRKELGGAVTAAYFLGVAGVSLAMGLLLEWILLVYGISISASLGHAHDMLPQFLSVGSAVILLVLAIRPVRRLVFPRMG